MIRSFLAIELPEELRKRIYESFARLHRQAPAVKWLEPSQMHVTLRFLGEVEEARLERELIPRLEKTLAEFKALKLSLKGVGIFPSAQRPRVFWLGLEGELTELKRMQLKIEKDLEGLEVHPKEKDFHPHLTLGRIKEIGNREIWQKAMEEYEKIDLGDFQVFYLSLFKSELTPTGPLYTRLKAFDLKASV